MILVASSLLSLRILIFFIVLTSVWYLGFSLAGRDSILVGRR